MVADVLHFGGNGHAAGRLDAARAALAGRPRAPRLVDVPYPGFEGRPRAATRDGFFDDLAKFCRDQTPVAGYASGIGALIALGLRGRGELSGLPLIFQGPVLWGLETRPFPRVMRAVPRARGVLQRLFALKAFQDHFAGKHFRKPLTGEVRGRFFEGYARCPAFGDFFDWFAPDWLRELERAFKSRPGSLDGVTVWLGGYDRVINRGEVVATEKALGVAWPLAGFPDWGHYPMIDEPEEWADALCEAVAGRE